MYDKEVIDTLINGDKNSKSLILNSFKSKSDTNKINSQIILEIKNISNFELKIEISKKLNEIEEFHKNSRNVFLKFLMDVKSKQKIKEKYLELNDNFLINLKLSFKI